MLTEKMFLLPVNDFMNKILQHFYDDFNKLYYSSYKSINIWSRVNYWTKFYE